MNNTTGPILVVEHTPIVPGLLEESLRSNTHQIITGLRMTRIEEDKPN